MMNVCCLLLFLLRCSLLRIVIRTIQPISLTNSQHLDQSNHQTSSNLSLKKSSSGLGWPSKEALKLSDTASLMEFVTSSLNPARNGRSKTQNSRRFLTLHGNSQVLSRTRNISSSTKKECDPYVLQTGPCDPGARYRTFSGACNNVYFSTYGSSLDTLQRLLPPEYEDNISVPRSYSVQDKTPLPNPRIVSLALHQSKKKPDTRHSLALMQWGQFVDHDLTHIPTQMDDFGRELDCQACDSARTHPACFPILLPSGETYHKNTTGCLAFTRSMPGQQGLGARQQLNQVSSYLDGSMVYGSNQCTNTRLRKVEDDGKLSWKLQSEAHPRNSSDHPQKSLLKLASDHSSECRAEDQKCFLSGDGRVNEQPGLTSFHTVLMREHNEVASELSSLNPSWNNDKVFHETRKIISAIIQHITFSEFLPRVLGSFILKKFDLELHSKGYYTPYNPQCSSSIFTEFASAAFRFGHSMIGPNISMITENHTLSETFPLRNFFRNPDMIKTKKDAIDLVIRGVVMSPMMPVDGSVSYEVANHLFELKGQQNTWMDLVAINIQRGRDHGIPGYNKYRAVCGMDRAHTFSELSGEIPADIVKRLTEVYKHPDDVDLFTGLLMEKHLPGALVGPTLGCLIALQFRQLRQCDRFWYESGDPTVRFTPAQLQEVRVSSLSSLLCRNCDKPGKLPRSAMDMVKAGSNDGVDCTQLAQPDIKVWKEMETVDTSHRSM